MKNKLSRIIGVLATVAIVASMLVVAIPASAGTLAWGSESTLPTKSGSDVVALAPAANGTTIYAAFGAFDFDTLTLPGLQPLAKSTNGGASWSAVNTGTATLSVSKVVVAPDVADGSWVAIVASDNSTGTPTTVVMISSDGGATWAMAPAIAATAVYDLAVSKPIGTTRTLAVAADNAVYTLDLGGIFGGVWVPVTGPYTGISTANLNGTTTAMRAVKFSPNFAGDRTLVVLSDNGSALLQMYNTASKAWNGQVYPGWGTGVVVAAVGSPASVLALAPTFLGSDPASRTAYVGGPVGLVRVGDTISSSALVTMNVASIALNAAGDKLVAGAADTNSVIRIASPATATATSVALASKRPAASVSNGTLVAFAGTTVVAGTSGPESAFSKSTDDGKTFIDISLVDTTFTPKDFNVSADGGKLYVVSYYATSGVLSVFRKATAWERTGAITTAATDFMVRVAPDNGDVVYVAEKTGGSLIYYTNDGGYTTWTQRYSPNTITDIAVESASTVYVLTGGYVSKSVDSGFLWDNPKTMIAQGMTGYSLTLLGAGSLVVGGTSGDVAYSTDGNVTWTKTSAGIGTGNNVIVTADKLSSGGNLYATSASAATDVYRWTIGTSTVWAAMRGATLNGAAVGIGLNSGALYVLDATYLYRTISPATAATAGSWTDKLATELSGTTTYNLVFVGKPNGLDISVGADKFPKLWALSLSTGTAPANRTALESFTDMLVTATPALTAPAERANVQINTASGQANNVVLQWSSVNGTSPATTTYRVQIALDSAFTQVVATSGDVADTMLIVGPTGTLAFPFQANTTYYWRVRVQAPFYSGYSAGRSFVISALEPIAVKSPANGANNVPVKPTFVWQPVEGATTYEIVVSDDPTFKIITFSRTTDKAVFASDEQLAYGTVYYWRVRASAPATAVTPWVTGVFTTEGKPVVTTGPAPTGPVITITQPAPTTITVEVPPTVEAIPAFLLWIIIGIGAILVIALIVLIVRTRRVS